MTDDYPPRVTSLLDALLTGKLPSRLHSRMARVRDGTYPESLDVEDGYPSDERVEEITMIAAVDARRWLRERFGLLWASMPCGSVELREVKDSYDEPARRITVTTGGWSGCESVIHAVLNHFVMRTYCREQHSGGLYVFVVPYKEHDA